MKKNNKYIKFFKTLSLIVSVLMVFTLFAGCGVSINEKDNTPENQTSASINEANNSSEKNEASKQEASYPITVKDINGTEVTIEKQPVKIVSLSLTADEILPSLVDKSRIAALSHLSDDPGLSNVVDQAKDIPQKARLELESLIALQPDLIIVSDFTDQNAVSQLRDANITVYAMKTPTNIQEVKNAVLEVANLVGGKQKGEEVIAWMNGKLKAVEDKVKTVKEADRIRVLSCDSFWGAYGKGTSFDSIAQHAGVINLASEAGIEFWQEVQKETIIEMNPDVMLLPSWSYEGFDAEQFTEDFKNDKSLAEVSAVKNNKVLNLPEKHMTTTSQYIVLGVEDLAKAVYPELFE